MAVAVAEDRNRHPRNLEEGTCCRSLGVAVCRAGPCVAACRTEGGRDASAVGGIGPEADLLAAACNRWAGVGVTAAASHGHEPADGDCGLAFYLPSRGYQTYQPDPWRRMEGLGVFTS